MTAGRIRARPSEVFGHPERPVTAARVPNPCSAPDDSGAFCLEDAWHPNRPGPLVRGAPMRHSTARRLTAEATRPCFCCRGGLERCDACKGRGYSEDRDTCDHCLGIGYRGCDFCGGSGLFACEAIAPERRVSVAVERIEEVARELRAVMQRPVPPASRDEPRRSLQEGSRALLQMNRLVATIEDGLDVLQAVPRNAPADNGTRSRIVRFCLQLAVECQRRMREILGEMAVSARALADLSEPDTESREVATRRAVFYASLLERSGFLTGTGFERPLLNAALARANEASASRALEQEPPEEKP